MVRSVRFFSYEYDTFMTLTWAGEPKGSCTIPPGSNAFIDVVFSPYREKEGRFEKISADWHGAYEWGPLIAWFAEPEAVKAYVKEIEIIRQRRHFIIEREYEIRLQSGPVKGEYEIDATRLRLEFFARMQSLLSRGLDS